MVFSITPFFHSPFLFYVSLLLLGLKTFSPCFISPLIFLFFSILHLNACFIALLFYKKQKGNLLMIAPTATNYIQLTPSYFLPLTPYSLLLLHYLYILVTF